MKLEVFYHFPRFRTLTFLAGIFTWISPAIPVRKSGLGGPRPTQLMVFETKGNVSGFVAKAASEHTAGRVAEKYRGSAADKRDMEIMGSSRFYE